MVEVSQAKLTGSLRISSGARKAVFYFDSGKLVYVVSNERAFRLSEILLGQQVIDKQFMSKHPRLVNDFQLSEVVAETGLIATEALTRVVIEQCESVVASVLGWTDGEWVFSPLSRLKTGISYDIDFRKILFEHCRNLSEDAAAGRFHDLDVVFDPATDGAQDRDLQPHEAFVLSRFDSGPLTLGQLIALSGLAQRPAMHIVYKLWIGGLILRRDWYSAFSTNRISAMLSANLAVKKRPEPVIAKKPAVKKPVKVEEPELPEVEETEFDLDEHLTRIEAAGNYYEVLDVEPSAKVTAIRKAYFKLAKLLHPDRYHNEETELLRRVERAFTELAQAHETLKNQETRQSYNIRLQQMAKDKETMSDTGVSGEVSRREDQAAQDFDRGFDLQLGGEFEAALPFLARAVYYAPKNARYHAYYGKALAADEEQRHKAEGELQAAVRLEPQNQSFRLMLAELFVRFKLIKRAEGELTRLLDLAPGNKEARTLLDSLQDK